MEAWATERRGEAEAAPMSFAHGSASTERPVEKMPNDGAGAPIDHRGLLPSVFLRCAPNRAVATNPAAMVRSPGTE
jgi:hypothetical protein